MSKRRDDTLTGDLLAWEPPKVAVAYEDEVAGHGHLDNKIARLVSRALRDAKDDQKLQRAVVARRMSDFLGRRINEEHLNKWSSEANDQHRIPLDAFVALIDVTGAKELLGFVPGQFDHVAMPARFADIVELHLIEEHEQEIADRKSNIMARVRSRR